MNDGGWIKLNRSMLQWGWYGDVTTKAVFLDILLNANYEDGEFRGEKIHAGECVIGRKKLAERLGVGEQRVRTALKHLHESGEISTIKATNKFTVVKVEKWAVYQGCEVEPIQQNSQQLTNNQPTTNQQLTTSKKERNKEVNKYNSYSYKGKPLWRQILDGDSI